MKKIVLFSAILVSVSLLSCSKSGKRVRGGEPTTHIALPNESAYQRSLDELKMDSLYQSTREAINSFIEQNEEYFKKRYSSSISWTDQASEVEENITLLPPKDNALVIEKRYNFGVAHSFSYTVGKQYDADPKKPYIYYVEAKYDIDEEKPQQAKGQREYILTSSDMKIALEKFYQRLEEAAVVVAELKERKETARSVTIRAIAENG